MLKIVEDETDVFRTSLILSVPYILCERCGSGRLKPDLHGRINTLLGMTEVNAVLKKEL